ncbi:MAG: molecular chaperone HtpG, partial [Micavibrio aeruginosavorus]
MTQETLTFGTDVSRLLDIVANALYTNRDVFLRELISNASDACDKLRYESLQDPALAGAQDFKVSIDKDTDLRTLSIADNGIGMTRQDLIDHLGTIARSGTAAMMEAVKNAGADKGALNLIGQFGVGFYASFMVAGKVEVITRKAGEAQAWHWESDGRSGYAIREADADEARKLAAGHGTYILLHLKDDASDFLLDDKIKQVVLAYSDHIPVPVYLGAEDKPLNAASALWMKSKNEVTKEQYTEFYHHIGHVFDDPMMTSHWRAEGKIEYSALLFVPTMRPWDLYDPGRKHAVRLYVKRVYITDQVSNLIYPWLRFIRGVIDSEDLPLNISREMLQNNPVVTRIRSGVTKRILSDLAKLAVEDETA